MIRATLPLLSLCSRTPYPRFSTKDTPPAEKTKVVATSFLSTNHFSEQSGYPFCKQDLKEPTPAWMEERREKSQRLIHAISSGNLEKARQALRDGANPNQAIEDGHYILHMATESDSPEIADALLAGKAKVNFTTLHEGDTAAHIAARIGSVKMVNILYKYNANFHKKNYKLELPVDVARRELLTWRVNASDDMQYRAEKIEQLQRTVCLLETLTESPCTNMKI